METNFYNGYMPNQNGYGYYDPNAFYNGNAYTFNQFPIQQAQSSLTKEQYQNLINAKPKNALDLSIEQADCDRAQCNHHDLNGMDRAQRTDDGDAWCPICNEKWSTEQHSVDEIKQAIKIIIDAMQVAKWLGYIPVEVVRQYFTIIPLLKKFPEIYEYAMNNFNKCYSQNTMQNAQDASVYSNFNSLFGPASYTNPFLQMQQQGMQYPQQPMNYQYLQQQPMQYPQQPMNNQFGQPIQYQQPASVNPMQIPMGVNPSAPNQQFVSQAASMMPGYQYPQQQQVMQQPMNNPYGQPQQQCQCNHNQQPVQQQQPANQQQQPVAYKPIVQDVKVNNNPDGTSSSSTTISV